MRCRRRVEQFVGAFGRRLIDFLRTSITVREGVKTRITPEASLEVVRRFTPGPVDHASARASAALEVSGSEQRRGGGNGAASQLHVRLKPII